MAFPFFLWGLFRGTQYLFPAPFFRLRPGFSVSGRGPGVRRAFSGSPRGHVDGLFASDAAAHLRSVCSLGLTQVFAPIGLFVNGKFRSPAESPGNESSRGVLCGGRQRTFMFVVAPRRAGFVVAQQCAFQRTRRPRNSDRDRSRPCRQSCRASRCFGSR